MTLTHREKHFLIIAAIIALSFAVIPAQHHDSWETILLYFFALPIGLYVVTDPERSKKDKKSLSNGVIDLLPMAHYLW